MAEAQVFVRDGKAFLQDANGQITTHDPAKVQDRLLSGKYAPVTAEAVAARDQERAAENTSGLRALGESAAAGAYDAAVAPATIPSAILSKIAGTQDPSAPLSGRAIMSEIAGIAGRRGEYEAGAREAAAAHPILSTIGTIGGSAIGGLGISGGARAAGAKAAAATGSKVLGTTVAGAAEGAALGGAAAREAAFLKDEDLTAESVLAGMGWGALVGGGVGLTLGGAAKLFGRSGTRGATPVDSPVAAGSAKLEQPMQETAERILGQPAAPGLGEKLRDAVEGAQSVASGAERDTLAQYGALRWDSTARRGRSLWRNREAILEGATADLTQRTDDIVKQSRAVMNEVVDSGLKREHVASKLAGNAETQLAAARAEAARLVDAVEQVAVRSDDFGNVALTERLNKFIGQRALEVAETADPAAAFISLDKAKRALQSWSHSLGGSARMSTDALKRQQAFAFSKELADLQEGTRQMLMDEGVWGAAGADQRSINAAWEKFFESKRMFDSHFVTTTGEEFGKAPIVVADPRKVASYVRGLGRSESALVDQHFRAHVQALDDLTSAIGGAYDLGPKAQAVAGVRAANKSIRSTLEAADETVRVANQIDAVMEAERGGGGVSALSGAFGGGVVGGAPGALLGMGAGILTRPGQMLRQMSALEVMAQNLDKKLSRGVGSFFKRSMDQVTIPKGLPTRRVPQLPGNVSVSTPTALELFRGKEDSAATAYRKKVAQLEAMTSQYGAGLREKTQQALGDDLPNRAPRLAGNVAAAATRGALFLKSKLPEHGMNLKSLTPNASAPVPSDYEIAKFARYWNTVANPMSVVRDLEQGTLTHEQVEALQVVYPKLYRRIQDHVMGELRKADAKGIEVPYQAKLQLDLLLNLGGAGEPTATPDFMLRFAQMQAAVTEQQTAGPRPQPVKMSDRYASRANELQKGI